MVCRYGTINPSGELRSQAPSELRRKFLSREIMVLACSNWAKRAGTQKMAGKIRKIGKEIRTYLFGHHFLGVCVIFFGAQAAPL